MRDLHPSRDTRLAGQQAVLEGERGPPLPVVEPGVVDAHRGPGGQFGGQCDVIGLEARIAGGPGEGRAAQHQTPRGQWDGQERGVAGRDLMAAGTPGQPVDGLLAEVIGPDRLAGAHGAEAG